MNKPTLVWHYTALLRLQQILTDGEIRPFAIGGSRKERPAVWFSASPRWEESANKLTQAADGTRFVLSTVQTHELGGGLARIAVLPDVAPHDWREFKQSSGISAKAASDIYNRAVHQGSRPSEWFATFDPVPQSKWQTVEVWDGARWLPYGPAAT